MFDINNLDTNNIVPSSQNADSYCLNNVNDLNNTIDQLAMQYILIYIQTDKLLNDFFKNNENSSMMSFPIDFFKLAEWLGIDVVYTDLNYFRVSKFSMQLGRLLDNSNHATILLEQNAPLLSLRYALAHEISHFLCSHNKIGCLEAKLPANREELITDIVASFLMLPPELTFDTALQFTQINKARPVDLNEIFVYLSSTAEIPYYHIITSYEHLKAVACYLRTEASIKKMKVMLEDFLKSQKNDNKKKYIKEKLDSLESIVNEEFFA